MVAYEVVVRERCEVAAAREGERDPGKGEKGAETGKRYYFDETNLAIYCTQRT
jgi:hypothetical protein